MIRLILENRSLAENNPLNLLKFIEAKKFYRKYGQEKFIELVWNVLDENE